ncbi:hypothetical protein TNCV_1881081 [Trichonephila clavipes]|nr:hypothetical protein TNCV_1881081 [Trichonephila clavipes]
MDPLKFKLEIVEALSASPPTNKSISTDDEDNSVVISLAKRSKHCNPPAIHVTTFIEVTCFTDNAQPARSCGYRLRSRLKLTPHLAVVSGKVSRKIVDSILTETTNTQLLIWCVILTASSRKGRIFLELKTSVVDTTRMGVSVMNRNVAATHVQCFISPDRPF